MTPRSPTNAAIADRLDEVAALLAEQGANPFRVRAYTRGAETVRALPDEAAALFARGGLEALTALPGIGEGLARSIRELLVHGRLAQLDRLRGEADPVALLRTVPGVGPALAERIHEALDCHTLEELEVAAHDGRLAALPDWGRAGWRRSATRWRSAWPACARPPGRGPPRGPPPIARPRASRPSPSCSRSTPSIAAAPPPAPCRGSRRGASTRGTRRGSPCSMRSAARVTTPRSTRTPRWRTRPGARTTGWCSTSTAVAASAPTRSSRRRPARSRAAGSCAGARRR